MMHSYEIRLLDGQGRLSLLYMTTCASDDGALRKIRTLAHTAYSRFEIWRDREKVAEGDKAP